MHCVAMLIMKGKGDHWRVGEGGNSVSVITMDDGWCRLFGFVVSDCFLPRLKSRTTICIEQIYKSENYKMDGNTMLKFEKEISPC